MKKFIRCAVVTLMLTPAVSAAQAQEMRPLGELLETAAAPHSLNPQTLHRGGRGGLVFAPKKTNPLRIEEAV